MNSEDYDRYNRQIKLPEIGRIGQQTILESSALVLGAGGLGSPVALYLASAGLGGITLVDYDRVEVSNLQRQIIHLDNSVGMLKVESAKTRLNELNPHCDISIVRHQLEGEELLKYAENANVIIDCTDNYPSRFELNDASIKTGTPLVSGAATRWEGYVSTFKPRDPSSPCYACMQSNTTSESASCTSEGVISPIVGVIGSMQALEAIHIILDHDKDLCGKIIFFDGITMHWEEIKLQRNPRCTACKDRPDY